MTMHVKHQNGVLIHDQIFQAYNYLRIQRPQIETFCCLYKRFHQISRFTLFRKSISCLREGMINLIMSPSRQVFNPFKHERNKER